MEVSILCDGLSNPLRYLHGQRGKPRTKSWRMLELCSSLAEGIPWKLIDNFYTSLSSANSLLEGGIYCTGTTRLNRVGYPHQLQATKLRAGESKWQMKELRNLALKWQDTKEVHLLLTMARPGNENIRRKKKGQVEGIVKECPSGVVDY